MLPRKAFALFAVVALAGLTACPGDAPPADEPPMDTAPPAAPDAPTMGMDPADLPEGVTPEMVTQGEQIFRGQGICYTCHGMNAEGGPLAPSLSDDQWVNISGRDYDEIIDVIRTGVAQPEQHPAPMPPMGGANLTDEQVRAVAAYVYSLN